MEGDPLHMSPPPKSASPGLWIAIGGGVLLCLCLVGAAVFASFAMINMSTEAVFNDIADQVDESSQSVGDGDPTSNEKMLGSEVMDVPIQGANHIDIGEPHEPYNSDPPTSGPHYPEWVDAGFYHAPVDDEFLVHNLEHGYVIIWYDCNQVTPEECRDLQDEIQTIIEEFDVYKVIGMPRPDMETLLALTTWGQLARLDSFDQTFIAAFIETYRNQAPEPNAP